MVHINTTIILRFLIRMIYLAIPYKCPLRVASTGTVIHNGDFTRLFTTCFGGDEVNALPSFGYFIFGNKNCQGPSPQCEKMIPLIPVIFCLQDSTWDDYVNVEGVWYFQSSQSSTRGGDDDTYGIMNYIVCKNKELLHPDKMPSEQEEDEVEDAEDGAYYDEGEETNGDFFIAGEASILNLNPDSAECLTLRKQSPC